MRKSVEDEKFELDAIRRGGRDALAVRRDVGDLLSRDMQRQGTQLLLTEVSQETQRKVVDADVCCTKEQAAVCIGGLCKLLGDLTILDDGGFTVSEGDDPDGFMSVALRYRFGRAVCVAARAEAEEGRIRHMTQNLRAARV